MKNDYTQAYLFFWHFNSNYYEIHNLTHYIKLPYDQGYDSPGRFVLQDCFKMLTCIIIFQSVKQNRYVCHFFVNINIDMDLFTVSVYPFYSTTYAISAYHHWCCEFEPHSWRGVFKEMTNISILFDTSIQIIMKFIIWRITSNYHMIKAMTAPVDLFCKTVLKCLHV
jgi:hypothetical protein